MEKMLTEPAFTNDGLFRNLCCKLRYTVLYSLIHQKKKILEKPSRKFERCKMESKYSDGSKNKH